MLQTRATIFFLSTPLNSLFHLSTISIEMIAIKEFNCLTQGKVRRGGSVFKAKLLEVMAFTLRFLILSQSQLLDNQEVVRYE